MSSVRALASPLEGVGAVVVKLGRGNVERERDVITEPETGLADRLGNQIERGAVALQIRREPALVTETGRQTARLQHRLQRVVGLRYPSAAPLRTCSRRSARP